MYEGNHMIAMVYARKVSLLQDIRLEYGFRQYLKSYCRECIRDVDIPFTLWIDYKEYTFCTKRCALRFKKRRTPPVLRRKPDMDDLYRLYEVKE